MMKNKSTLAKLLAEEDIFVVHKKMDTAYFNPKSRELGLPIWKDEEMTKDIYDLMVCHEIAHALWTPLDMLEKAMVRKINHSFVNIIEDARIERMVQERYPGSVAVFNRGYNDLTGKDFFGIGDKDVAKLNLIDRINLFFKKQKVEFTTEEMPWVKRIAKTKTPDDVLNLSEELYAWMAENAPEEDGDDEKMIDGSGNGESGEGEEGETGEGDAPADGNETGEGDAPADGEGEKEDGEDVPANGSADDGDNDADGDAKNEKVEGSEVGGVESTGPGSVPKAETDTDVNNAIEKLIDKTAENRTYGRIPALNEDLIMPYGEILEKALPNYAEGGSWVEAMKAEVAAMKGESKKTVAYMAKEFEMKKAADQYARAAVSKSGSLDMGRLHTYKYNEDLFKKVTTLPGATNHGMVMVVDWSGSMYENLSGTLSQLFNLVWFCRRTQIPFEVFAFSDNRDLFVDWSLPNSYEVLEELNNKNFKAGDIALRTFKLLNFFSSKMSAKEEIEMMEILWMGTKYYTSRYNREYNYTTVPAPQFLNLGGTPLNDAIIAMMEIVPKFKRETGVQKVNTIFLTDGASNRTNGVYEYRLNTKTGDHEKVTASLYDKIVISDPKTFKTYEIDSGRNGDMTDGLLRILKDRVSDMNLIGFFIAGSGRSGRVDKRTLYYLQSELSWDEIREQVTFINKNKFLAIDSKGYDEMYVLPAKGMEVSNEGLSDELVGASKAKLKTAFGKAMSGKIDSRQLLNKFVKLVA
jgi:hypothetical protein